MGLVNFSLPSFDEGSLDSKRELKRIKEYLYQLTEQLKFTLMNLDDENLSGEFVESVDRSKDILELRSTLASIRSNLSSYGDVKKASIISSINASGETEKISAGRVEISGYSGEIPSLAVKGSNLSKDNYASGTLYLLGITPNGDIKLCQLSVQDGDAPSATLTVVPVAPEVSQ